MGLALGGLAWTAAYSEGSRRDHEQKTLVVQVAVVAVRLSWFAGMTASGCAGHVPEDPTRNVIQQCGNFVPPGPMTMMARFEAF